MISRTDISSIPYSVHSIERGAELRKDHVRLMSQISAGNARIIPLYNDRHVILNSQSGLSLALFSGSEELVKQGKHPVFLGISEDRLIYALDLSHLEDPDILINGEVSTEFEDLRKISMLLSPGDASLANYSRGLIYWHKTHQYCHRCGKMTVSSQGGLSRICTQTKCSHMTFPRISPAVIVLVEHRPKDGSPPRCLLAKGHRSWGNIRSTLAGFAEVGENLEMAVKREIKEEAGIDVYNIRYIGSQPWPFPSSLMIGFFAETDRLEIKIDPDEILEADWYTVDDLKRQVKAGELTLSRDDSIARFLITSWMTQNDKV